MPLEVCIHNTSSKMFSAQDILGSGTFYPRIFRDERVNCHTTNGMTLYTSRHPCPSQRVLTICVSRGFKGGGTATGFRKGGARPRSMVTSEVAVEDPLWPCL